MTIKLLKFTDKVRMFLPELDAERIFYADLDLKEERYYLHRVFGKLSSMQIRLMTSNELKSNKELQEIISNRDIEKLVMYGFLKYTNSDGQGFYLTIKFNSCVDVYSVKIKDEYTQKSVEISTKHPIFEKACFCALSEFFRNQRGNYGEH